MATSQTNLAWDVLLDLAHGNEALHQRLTRALRDAIRAGRLPVGSALPPSRFLAAELRISRWTVMQAYDQLIAEGYLEARAGSATRVRWAAETSPQEQRRSTATTPPVRFDMTPGRPDLRGFPVHKWISAMRSAMASAPHDQLGYPDEAGTAWLREVLAHYLSRVRGAAVSASSVTICFRAADAMTRMCRVLLSQGISHLAVEEPCWPQVRAAAAAAGVTAVPVPVDEHGLSVSDLAAQAQIRAVCVSATHQFPTGVVLAPNRRASLLDWAHRSDGVIVEDDYDAEFRYDRPPVAALQGMAPDRVCLLGSVSKTLVPAVGIGWIVTAPRFTQALRDASPIPLVPPALQQLALAAFIESGSYDRYLRTARQRYRVRRSALLAALGRQLPGCQLSGAAAGLHLLLWLPAGCDAGVITTSAAGLGVHLASLDRFRARPDPGRPALVLGYGNLADSAADEAVSLLARVITDHLTTGR
jgi:GntR family transcriptional regulator/MocR family aminotransferase